MSSKKYAVGAEVEAYCTKCKVDRLHVIETLKSDGNINRVLCRTCEGLHLFRRPKSAGGKKKRTGTAAARRKKGSFLATEEDLAQAKPYAQDGVFEVGDVIKHKQFGPGSVAEVRHGGRMVVHFEEGPKLMVCGHSGTTVPAAPRSRKASTSKS